MQPERLDLALAQGATLGEGLQWHAASGRWWWTDIEARRIHAWTPGAGATLSCLLPDRVGSFAHTRSGGLLLALAKRLVLAHPLSGSLFGGRCAAGLYLAETLFDDRP